MTTIVSRPTIATLMGIIVHRLLEPTPAEIRATRMASVAYATDEIASEERTARALNLVRRSCSDCAVAIGAPINRRFRRSHTVRGACVTLVASSKPIPTLLNDDLRDTSQRTRSSPM